MSVYLGVDAGGTKTQTFLVNTEAKRAVSIVGESANPGTVGWATARDTVLQLIFQTLQAAGASPEQLSGLSIGMAGIDRPQQVERMTQELSSHLPAGLNMEVVNDALPALTAGTRGASGVVLIAGTGSIAVGEDTEGHMVRSGGFGNLIGDEGSGCDIGRRGLMAAVQAAEGRGPQTQLWERAADFFQVSQPGDIIPQIYESNNPVGTVASFAREVIALGDVDEVASNILSQAISSYVQLVESVFSRFPGPADNHVVLAGGLFTHAAMLRDGLIERLPERHFTLLDCSAAAGAALRAMRNAEDRKSMALWEEVVRQQIPSSE